MFIRMLKTRRGCADGLIVREYCEGQTYLMNALLARAFIKNGSAIEISPISQENEYDSTV